MIRTLLTSTAVVALLTTGALAQQATAPATGANQAMDTQQLLTQGYQFQGIEDLASRLIGTPVFNAQTADAEQIGEVNDLIIAETGEVNAVLIGVGGFLGVGERDVAVSFNDLQWSLDDQNNPRLFINVTQDALAAAPAIEIEDQYLRSGRMDTAQQPMTTDDQMMQDDQVAQQPLDQDVDPDLQTGAITADPAQPVSEPHDPFNPAGATALDMAALTADELMGTDVYGPDNQHIGPIGDLVLAEDGQTIDALVIDFGGFLGIGVKQVAVAYENLQFYSDEWGNRSLVLPLTREQMEAAPEFNRDSFATQRDQQLLLVDGTAGAAASAS